MLFGKDYRQKLAGSRWSRAKILITIVPVIISLVNETAAQDTSGNVFNFDTSRSTENFNIRPPEDLDSRNTGSSDESWQPGSLRSSFRPLNRPLVARTSSLGEPTAPTAPEPPRVPSVPESLALLRRSSSSTLDNFPLNNFDVREPSPSSFTSAPTPDSENNFDSLFGRISSSTASTSTSTTPAPASTLSFIEEEEQPTRLPMSRFRPTRAPSDELDESRRPPPLEGTTAGGSPNRPAPNPNPTPNNNPTRQVISTNNNNSNNINNNNNSSSSYVINNECFECICEASTNCNAQSRCQTSDVRHTRCGLFLLSYNEWQASGLSQQLVSAESRARDVAADERAYYECATSRDCAEQMLSGYMANKLVDCDRDSRLDCYDVAAVHQAGPDQCNSEFLLESQYWTDFNACYGFARR